MKQKRTPVSVPSSLTSVARFQLTFTPRVRNALSHIFNPSPVPALRKLPATWAMASYSWRAEKVPFTSHILGIFDAQCIAPLRAQVIVNVRDRSKTRLQIEPSHRASHFGF